METKNISPFATRRVLSTARLSLPLASAIAALFAAQSVHAGNTWDGGDGTGFWNTNANWNLDTAPLTETALTFGGNVQNRTTNNLGATDPSFAGILFTNTGAANNSSAFILEGNRITLGGNITTTANTAGATITDRIELDMILNGDRTITTNQQSASVQHNLTISGNISSNGTFGLTKAGNGTLVLSGANTYNGTTTVSAGTLTLSGNRTVSTTGNYTVAGSGTQTLNIQNGNYGIGSFIVGQSGGTATVNHSAGIISVGGNGIFMGNGQSASFYNLSGGELNARFIVMGFTSGTSAASPTTSTIAVSGGALNAEVLRVGRWNDGVNLRYTNNTFTQTAGTSNITTLGLGSSTLNGNATGPHTANLNLTGGSFTATNFASLSAGGNATNSNNANSSFIHIGGTAQVTLGAFPTARGANSTANITFDTIAGGGGFLAPAAASATYMPANTFTNAFLTANGANFNVVGGKDITIGQALQDASGAAGALTKIGDGNLTLSGNNTYTGNTNVSGGTLRINGANSGNGAVNVDSGATLGGSGSVIGGINVSGVLAPGANSNSIESFRGGALSFGSTSTYAYQLQTLGLTGDLAHSTSELNIATGAILSLTDISTSTVRSNGDKLTLISYMGAWNGGLFSYNSNTLANGSEITLGANKWMFKYDDIGAGSNFGSDTTGANRFVTMTVVPEPSVAVLLGGICTMLMLRRRRA